MDSKLTALKAQLDMHTNWYNNVLRDISNEESHLRADERLNHMKWIAGHLLNTRLVSMNRIAGLDTDETYKPLFDRGAALTETDSYPQLDQILARWNDTATAISTMLAGLPAEKLGAASPAQLPIADNTVHGVLLFLISHEAFHIGQLSMLRRLAGKAPMAYM